MKEIVFVVLVYKTTEDLVSLLQNIHEFCTSFQVLVVNSYCDEESSKCIQKVAKEYGADFIEVENKGYSYGNNQGIAYALRVYQFEWLVVCNPDVTIKKWNLSLLDRRKLVYGPIIKKIEGKSQNPFMMYPLPFFEWIAYKGYKHNLPMLPYILFVVNRLIRELSLFFFYSGKEQELNVYGIHGAFLIFSKKFLCKSPYQFLDTMFLFNEERFFAWKLKKQKIQAVVTKAIEVCHKGDGTIKSAGLKGKEARWNRESFMRYYEFTHGDSCL